MTKDYPDGNSDIRNQINNAVYCVVLKMHLCFQSKYFPYNGSFITVTPIYIAGCNINHRLPTTDNILCLVFNFPI
jgi:hypothetical protein